MKCERSMEWWTEEDDKEALTGWREEGRRRGGREGASQDKHCVVVFFFSYSSVSPASLGAVDNSLSGNQMLIKRKLHSIGGQQNRKEKPHPLPPLG